MLGGTVIKNNTGITCYTLRTGWATTQGKLLNTILYSSERASVNNKEAFLFIGILLNFALIAVWYLITYSIQERNPTKLLLKSIIIITSVVPPELPVELALAVNASIIALQLKQIFCTEPFRLPFAGKITTCCFDKTGTLTDSEFNLIGVALPQATLSQSQTLKSPKNIQNVKHIIAGCHSLMKSESNLIGDPIEIASFININWQLNDSIA